MAGVGEQWWEEDGDNCTWTAIKIYLKEGNGKMLKEGRGNSGICCFPPKSNYLCVANAHWLEACSENFVGYLLKLNIFIKAKK